MNKYILKSNRKQIILYLFCGRFFICCFTLVEQVIMDHKKLKERAKSFIENNDDNSIIESSSNYKPDICLKNSSFWDDSDKFDEIWIEIEISSIRRPSNIVRKVMSACEKNAKLVFGVPARNDKRRDYYANRIDKIVGPPELVSRRVNKNKYELYVSEKGIKTDNNKRILVPKSYKSLRWIVDEQSGEINLIDGSKSLIVIEEPKRNMQVKENQIENYSLIDNKVILSDDSSIKIDKCRKLKMPIYPFVYPRNRIDKIIGSIEYLIFSENIIYQRKHPKVETYLQSIHH